MMDSGSFLPSPQVLLVAYGIVQLVAGVSLLLQPSGYRDGRLLRLWPLLAAHLLLHPIGDLWAAVSAAPSETGTLGPFLATSLSYLPLFEFGRRLLGGRRPLPRWTRWSLPSLLGVVAGAAIFSGDPFGVAPPLVGYMIRFPAGLMTAAGFMAEARHTRFGARFSLMAFSTGAAALLWSVACGLVRPGADFFPANWVNEAGFQAATGVPVLVFRLLSAAMTAAFAVAMGRAVGQHRLRTMEEVQLKLAKASEIKNRLLGIAAHDLRNPLTVMIGHLGLLQEEVSDGAHKRELAIVQRKSKMMLSIIDSLLDSSIIESRGLRLELDLLDLGEFLGQLCADVRILAEDKSIRLKLQIEPGLPAVTADRPRLQQVFDNLISNAIKYSPPGKTVVVSARTAGKNVEIAVSDEGQGIRGEDLSRLFKEYGRADVRPTGGERSVGLGLSIAQRIVRAHGGSLRVESLPGAGTTFRVSLPLRRKEDGPSLLDLR